MQHRVGHGRGGPGLRNRSAQGLIQEKSEGIQVGTAVHHHGNRTLFPRLCQGHTLLRRHIRGRSAQPPRLRPARLNELIGEVEVQKHRLRVGGKEHVGRLHVQVHQAASVSVLQGVGQAGANPADGLDIRGPSEELTNRIPRRQVDPGGSLRTHREPGGGPVPCAGPGVARPVPSTVGPAWPRRNRACTEPVDSVPGPPERKRAA